jgi:hypothetical protein
MLAGAVGAVGTAVADQRSLTPVRPKSEVKDSQKGPSIGWGRASLRDRRIAKSSRPGVKACPIQDSSHRLTAA